MEHKFKNLFENIRKLKQIQEKQKQRGLNDYNMVNVVRKATEEVGTHSNVIYSLLNPKGKHYQDDLFLNLFIKYIIEPKIKDENYTGFGEIIAVNTEEVTSALNGKNKQKRIDFTIKSSKYYIGIEMKINHHDSKNQLYNYYQDLTKKAQEDNNQVVKMFYLTKFGKAASSESTKGIEYYRISFKNDILNWIKKCQEEVQNITNLNQALEDYKNIIKKLTNQYKSKVVQMEDFLLTDNNMEYLDEVFELKNSVHKMLGNILFNLFKNIDNYIVNDLGLEKIIIENYKQQNYDKKKCIEVFYNDEKVKNHQKTEYIGSFFKLNDDLLLRIELATIHFHIGLVAYHIENNKYKLIYKKDKLEEIIKKYNINKNSSLQLREWKGKSIIWYSIDCGNFINPTDEKIKRCYKDKFENCFLKKHIDVIINYFQNA